MLYQQLVRLNTTHEGFRQWRAFHEASATFLDRFHMLKSDSPCRSIQAVITHSVLGTNSFPDSRNLVGRFREPAALKDAAEKWRDEIESFVAEQFLFDRQWKAVKAYANERNIKVPPPPSQPQPKPYLLAPTQPAGIKECDGILPPL